MANRKQVQERVLVFKGNVALKNGASAGDNIWDIATQNYILADGQLGLVYQDKENIAIIDELVDVVTDIADLKSKKIQFVQGTPYSGTAATLQNGIGANDQFTPRVLRSGIIDVSKPIRAMSTGQLSNWERYSAGKLSGLTAVSNVNYKLHLKVDGTALSKVNGAQNIDNMSFRILTPDFTALGTVSPTDYIYKNLAYKMSQSSAIFRNPLTGTGGYSPYMVFGVCATGQTTPASITPAAYTMPLVSGLILGTATSIVQSTMVNPSTGTLYFNFFTPDEGFRQMLIEAVANGYLLSTDRIGVIDVTQAGASTTANAFKGILVTGMKQSTALVQDEQADTILTTVLLNADKTVELNSPSATLAIASRRANSNGKSANWLVRYKEDADFDIYTRQVWGSNFDLIQKYVPIDANKWYTSYIFESELHETEFNGHSYSVGEVITVRTILLVESAAPVTTAATPGVTGATSKASLITYVTPILDTVVQKLGYSAYTFN